MLTFYHDLGRIIYFGGLCKEKRSLKDIVVLNPQWLIGVFKQVITIANPRSMVGSYIFLCKIHYNSLEHVIACK